MTMHPKIKLCIDSCVTPKQLQSCISFVEMFIMRKAYETAQEILDYIFYQQKILEIQNQNRYSEAIKKLSQ